jgi:hypothetical protein
VGLCSFILAGEDVANVASLYMELGATTSTLAPGMYPVLPTAGMFGPWSLVGFEEKGPSCQVQFASDRPSEGAVTLTSNAPTLTGTFDLLFASPFAHVTGTFDVGLCPDAPGDDGGTQVAPDAAVCVP